MTTNERFDSMTTHHIADTTHIDVPTECQMKMLDLTNDRYDEAERALNMLDFVSCAWAAMETIYSDEVVNGCGQIIDGAICSLREYIGDTRAVLISALGSINKDV